MGAGKWVRSSLRSLSRRLQALGHAASPPTVGRLLRSQDYHLRVNAKKREASAAHPDRQTQFAYLERQIVRRMEAGLPVISVDTKKKELVGNFKNAGPAWGKQPQEVNAHDFPQDALGRAVPYGIYDLVHQQGAVYVGTSADTPEFAVAAIASWWESRGRAAFPEAGELAILADAGGSNSCRARAWKQQLQEQVCDRFGLTVTVCHYPTGCSKWNPIEHRLFSQISRNWAGKPLRTWETVLGCIGDTETVTGLKVEATLVEREYRTGKTVSEQEMGTLNLERHAVCPTWNYTIRPRQTGSLPTVNPSENREVIL